MFSPINWLRGFSISINYLLRNRRCQNVSRAKLPDTLESAVERVEMREEQIFCELFRDVPHFVFHFAEIFCERGNKKVILQSNLWFLSISKTVLQTALLITRSLFTADPSVFHKVQIMHWLSVSEPLAAPGVVAVTVFHGRNHLKLYCTSEASKDSSRFFRMHFLLCFDEHTHYSTPQCPNFKVGSLKCHQL